MIEKQLRTALVFTLLIAIGMSHTPTVASQALLIVNTTDDIDDGFCNSTHCSLREAILTANGREGPDNITFDTSVFPLQGSGVIQLTAALPPLHDMYTTIDASNAGVIVDGGNLTDDDIHGFQIYSSGNTLRGIRLQNIPGVGVMIADFEGNEVHNNIVDDVVVVDSGYGGPDLSGRIDGIWILAYCKDCRACRNKIINCTVENVADDGIEVWTEAGGVADENIIIGNTVRNVAEVGIEIDVHGPGGSANSNKVVNNLVEDTREQAGIVLNAWSGGSANGNIILSNILTENAENGFGIYTGGSGSSVSANLIKNNVIENHSSEGILVAADEDTTSGGNYIVGNTISHQFGEGIGILLYSNDNLVYLNSLVNLHSSAEDNGHYNSWDYGGRGNYWSDYTGQDQNGDGIGDTPYLVPPNGVDNYPLMTHFAYEQIFLPILMKGYLVPGDGARGW